MANTPPQSRSVVSDEMSQDAMDIRVVHISRTFADIAGLPLREGDEVDPVKLQKLPERVKQCLGVVNYDVVRPELIPHGSGVLRFPRYEVMAVVSGRPNAIILYTDKLSADIEALIQRAARDTENTTRTP